MAVSYKIEADIVDIRSDIPSKTDSFFVDTNVWYWFTYSAASILANHYQTKYYPEYIKKILTTNAGMKRCELILSEIAHLIEKSEYDIFCTGLAEQLTSKEFRHNYPEKRKDVVEEIEIAWETVCNSSESFAITMDEKRSNDTLEDLKKYCLDCYDIVYLREMKETMDLPMIITDDGDFATVPEITVFTANNTIIKAAQAVGKLIKR